MTAHAHAHDFDIPTVYDRDPDDIAKTLWKGSGVPPENYVRWSCPCCDGVKAIAASDTRNGRNHVWLILVSSTRTDGRDIIRLDSADEVSELLAMFPCPPDRWLLAAWYAGGLDEVLRGLFGS